MSMCTEVNQILQYLSSIYPQRLTKQVLTNTNDDRAELDLSTDYPLGGYLWI